MTLNDTESRVLKSIRQGQGEEIIEAGKFTVNILIQFSTRKGNAKVMNLVIPKSSLAS